MSSCNIPTLVRPYRNTIYSPFQRLGAEALPLYVPSQRHETFSRDIDIGIGLGTVISYGSPLVEVVAKDTSTVSNTLMTPGCRSVRSFFSAFFARDSCDLWAVMSKENMLQFDPSSCGPSQSIVRLPRERNMYVRCVLSSCRCRGSRSTGQHRRCLRKNMGRQDPWRLQMRRLISGNPWREGT